MIETTKRLKLTPESRRIVEMVATGLPPKKEKTRSMLQNMLLAILVAVLTGAIIVTIGYKVNPF